MEDSGGEICVCCYDISCAVAGDTGTADDEGDVDVFFVGAGFSGGKAVLAYVETIIYTHSIIISLHLSYKNMA